MPGWLKRWLYRILALAGVVGLVLFVRDHLQDSEVRVDRFAQRIRLLEPPLPPPPPRKIEEQPPDTVVKQEVKIEKAQEDAGDDKPVMDDRLGVDAEGGSGSDPFGLAAKKGGKDLLATAKLGGGDEQRFGHYASQIERFLERALSRNKDLRQGTYTAIIRLWVGPAGRLQRYELSRSSGDPTVDASLREALAELDELGLPPPQGLPQPVRLRVTSRTAG